MEQSKKSCDELEEEIRNLRTEISSLRQVAQNAENKRIRETARASQLASEVGMLKSGLELCKVELAKATVRINRISRFITQLDSEGWPFCTKIRVCRAIRWTLPLEEKEKS